MQWKGPLDYFLNFITEYYRVKHSKVFFELKNWSILPLLSLILGPPGKVDEDGEFWGDHILIPGV